jgi:hypothetical protein
MTMRCALAVALLSSPTLADAAGAPRHKRMPHCMEFEQADPLFRRLENNPPYLTPERLPAHLKIGRCLFVVRGKRIIDGKCAYGIGKGGEFEIQGPRQIYRGVDYPECFEGAAAFSTDHFVQVTHPLLDDLSQGAGWVADWNEDKGANYAQWQLGPVTRHGACFSNSETKICLWKR